MYRKKKGSKIEPFPFYTDTICDKLLACHCLETT